MKANFWVVAACLLLPLGLSAAPAQFVMRDYLVYRDYVASLDGGAVLTLGEWDHHDAQDNWLEVPRVINGRLSGPGTVTSRAYNGLCADPAWQAIEVVGSYQNLEIRGAADNGQQRGQVGNWSPWYPVTGTAIPAELVNKQYLSYRISLRDGDEVQQINLTLQRDIRDSHPRLLVDDLQQLRSRCSGQLAHQCEMNSLFANSAHLTDSLSGYSDSRVASVAKSMAFDYMMHGGTAQAQRARAILLHLSSNNRQHWVDLRSQIQDLGLGWIGLSWMLALDWIWDSFDRQNAGDLADMQAIADGTAVFVDYLLEMYKHNDFNNHFHLGRSPVLLAGIVMHNEGLRDTNALRYLDLGFGFMFNHEHPGLNAVAGDMGGWHESLGYFDGEMGYPIAVDMEGLRTATGLDFFADSSFWRSLAFWYLQSTVTWDRSLIHWADQGKDRWSTSLDGSEAESKGTRSYMSAVHKNLMRLGYAEAEQVQYLLDHMVGAYYDSGTYGESYYKVQHYNDVLFYSPGAISTGLDNQQTSSHFAALGEVIMRQGTDTDDAMAMFACADFRGGHQQADNGHFSIWYKGYLAVDSGYYDHWGTDHHMNYSRRTIAHNTLTVTMPGETFTNTDHNDGGQHFSCNTVYYNSPAEDADCNTCDMVLSSRTAPYFDFISADLTKSYNSSKVSRVTRQFVWIRPDLFVVFDRITSTDASYQKRFLLHGASAFVDDTEAWFVDHGEGRLFMRTVLPENPVVTQVGGSGQQWQIGGTNYQPASGEEFAGSHRLEVTPPSPQLFDHFLHVLQTTDQTVSAMAGSELKTADNAVGLLVQDWLVWFGREGSIDSLSYTGDSASPSHVIVGDLQPLTAYEISLGGTTVTETSDAHGVLYFVDSQTGQHVVALGEGVCPDADNDGYLDQACGGQDCDDNNDQVYPGHGCGGDAGQTSEDAAVFRDDAGGSGQKPDSKRTSVGDGCGCGVVAVSPGLALLVAALSITIRGRRRNEH